MKATLILANGSVFSGQSIGATADVVCEMVFNTSMVGYQEILTDPSYAGQGIVMSYPLIGNYGVNSEDNESGRPWAEAFVVRHLADRGSNFRCEGSVDGYLKEHGITGIQGVDTRAITRILRSQGTMNGMITCAEDFCIQDCLEKIAAYRVKGTVEAVTCKAPTVYEPTADCGSVPNVALLDYGVKRSMLGCLTGRGCRVTVFPAHTPAETILSGGFDGVLLSNGPGDPADNVEIIAELKKLYDDHIPIFGVCMGHQLLALAAGFQTRKMRFGHRGANHPVRDQHTGRTQITSQNHGYVVTRESVDPAVAEVSHINVNEGSVEGLCYKRPKCFSVQFHPEAAPGPKDTKYLFNRFVAMMRGEEDSLRHGPEGRATSLDEGGKNDTCGGDLNA